MSQKQTAANELRSDHAGSLGRLLAIDLGRKRIGLALSDEMRLSVRPLPHIERTSWKKFTQKLSDIIREFDVVGLVVGLPLRSDGDFGEEALEARKTASNLMKQFSIQVILQDERLTSRAAEESLRARGVKNTDLKKYVDGEAAKIILLDYLARIDTIQTRAEYDGDN